MTSKCTAANFSFVSFYTFFFERPKLLLSLLILYLVVMGSLILCSRDNSRRQVGCRSSSALLQAITAAQPLWQGTTLQCLVTSQDLQSISCPQDQEMKQSANFFLMYVIYCNSFHVFSSFYRISALLPVLTLVWPSSLKSDLPKWIANGIIVAPTWHHHCN